MPSLEEKAASRNLGETPKSKFAQAAMADVPSQTLGEELSKGDPKLAEELDKGFEETAKRMRQERGPERRLTEGSAPEGTPERRSLSRRQNIQEIKRLRGELVAEEARRAIPTGRDTLIRNVPKIKERIENLRRGLIETAPGPSGRLAGLSRAASKVGGRALGVYGALTNIPEHWRAANVVESEENKDSLWIDKFAAYSERVLGMEPGSSGRRALPSEVRAARQL